MQWAPLDPSYFDTASEQTQFVSAKRWLQQRATQLLARASPLLEANLEECSKRGCTRNTCPLHTGCVLCCAQTLLPPPSEQGPPWSPDAEPSSLSTDEQPEDVTLQWLTLSSLTAFRRHGLLKAAFSYDRTQEVCVLLLIPSDVLRPLFKPGVAPPEVGVFGVGTVPLRDLGKALVNVCFRDAAAHLPDTVTAIHPHMLSADPTRPDKQHAVPILGLGDASLHGCLPTMPWGSATNYPWAALAPALPKPAPPGQAAEPSQQLSDTIVLRRPEGADAAANGEDSDDGEEGGGVAAGQAGKPPVAPQGSDVGSGRGPQAVAGSARASSTGTGACPALGLPPAVPLTPQQHKVYLQATVNKFWATVGGMAQRLTNRVRKIRCRERLGCDGVTCDWCRGAMVFSVSALEGPSGQAWRYVHAGQEMPSNAPKTYIRGEWRTTHELVQGLGSTDVELLRTCVSHDRKQGYVQALHIPHRLVAECVPHAPPTGLLFWRLAKHLELTPPASTLPPPAPGALRSPRLSTASATAKPAAAAHHPPPPDSEFSYKTDPEPSTANVNPPPSEDGASGAPPGPGYIPSAFTNIPKPLPSQLPPGPRQCSLPGCEVREERYTGVRLLLCSACKAAAYCTPDHQRAHHRAHRKLCAAVALAAEASGPVGGGAREL